MPEEQLNSTLAHRENPSLPLCVDLDGTLINSDLLIESLFAFLRANPGSIMQIPFWFARGKPFLKEQLVQRVTIPPATLPYHQEFLDYLRKMHASGRRLILVTASHQFFAEQVAAHLGIFAAVFGTENGVNLSHSCKGAHLKELYGAGGFDYAGNSRDDLAVWEYSRSAILVNPACGLKKQVSIPITEIFDDRRGKAKFYFQVLHPLRWSNNFLLLLPLFIYQQYSEAVIIQAGWAFLTLSLCGSSSYIFSDLLNLAQDRQSATTANHNLFVHGRVAIIHGAILMPLFLAIGLFIAILTLPLAYSAVLVVYYLLSVIYHVMMQSYSVFVKTLLYMSRIIAGQGIIT